MHPESGTNATSYDAHERFAQKLEELLYVELLVANIAENLLVGQKNWKSVR